jgi:predicted metal-dependent hydrolase
MSDHAIDEAILSLLSAADGHWKKVAMVISRVANAMGKDLPEGDHGYQQVARRVEALVSDGRLIAQGDIKNWRFSEVRRPN